MRIKFVFLIFILLLSTFLYLFSKEGWENVFYKFGRYFEGSTCINNKICAVFSKSNAEVFITKDGGKTWNDIIPDSVRYKDINNPIDRIKISLISFIDDSSMIIILDSGNYIISKNHFSLWEKYKLNYYEKIKSIKMLNKDIGFALTDHLLYKFTNNATKTEIIRFPDFIVGIKSQKYLLHFFDFPDSNLILISYQDSTGLYFLKSDDLASSWSIISHNISNIGMIDCVDSMYCWAVPFRIKSGFIFDVIYHSNDGGITWIEQFEGKYKTPFLYIFDLDFYDRNQGVIVGNDGKFIYTTNGGLDWSYYDIWDIDNKVPDFTSCVIPDKNTILVFTQHGYILRYDKNTLNINDKDCFFKFSIFPNPAKDYIEIIYNVETGLRPLSTDEINIYNILGECVLSEKIHPITLSYRMNIEYLPSGIYFVRLGDLVERFIKIE